MQVVKASEGLNVVMDADDTLEEVDEDSCEETYKAFTPNLDFIKEKEIEIVIDKCKLRRELEMLKRQRKRRKRNRRRKEKKKRRKMQQRRRKKIM